MKLVGVKLGLLVMLAGLCAVAAAQQPADTTQETAVQEQPGEDRQPQVREEDQEPAEQLAPGPTSEEFEPTEQISEDLSVSFPVDI